MAKILILYSTTDGHTRKISQRLQRILEERAHEVSLVSITDEPGIDLRPFDRIAIGASIRYGRHSRQMIDFINCNVQALETKPSAFFSVNLVARKPGKSQPATNPYLKKLLKRIDWKPKNLAVFAGKLDYPRYNTLDRMIIRLIMWITRGPTDPKTAVEFTDWSQVDAFGRLLAE
jgi:menaquinone-dependent protoporphyrinogen oxidase